MGYGKKKCGLCRRWLWAAEITAGAESRLRRRGGGRLLPEAEPRTAVRGGDYRGREEPFEAEGRRETSV